MSETAKKPNQASPEGYQPKKPEVLSVVEETLINDRGYSVYKDIEYRIDIIELEEPLKFAGVTSKNNPDFQNIEKYHNEFSEDMKERHLPYTEVAMFGTMTDDPDYIFGCQVDSLEGLPDGLLGIDTGLKKFAAMTFRANDVYELVGAENPGKAMNTATEYVKEVWIPEHMEQVIDVDLTHVVFHIKTEEKEYHAGMIEVYPVDINDDAQMCFYIPLK